MRWRRSDISFINMSLATKKAYHCSFPSSKRNAIPLTQNLGILEYLLVAPSSPCTLYPILGSDCGTFSNSSAPKLPLVGPSGKTCPRCPPQFAHLHSILPSHSRFTDTRLSSIVFQKDGHPLPESYFAEEGKSGERQLAHM